MYCNKNDYIDEAKLTVFDQSEHLDWCSYAYIFDLDNDILDIYCIKDEDTIDTYLLDTLLEPNRAGYSLSKTISINRDNIDISNLIELWENNKNYRFKYQVVDEDTGEEVDSSGTLIDSIVEFYGNHNPCHSFWEEYMLDHTNELAAKLRT